MIKLSNMSPAIVALLMVGCLALVASGCARQGTPDVPPETSTEGSESGAVVTDADAILQQAVQPKSEEEIRYAVPEGWSPVESSGLQKASFQVAEGALSTEVSIMGMPGAATQLLPNVNLWRKQVGLGETTQEELDKVLQPIEIGGRSGHYIQLTGPPEAEQPLGMLAALISNQDRTWFIKMLGDVELVQRQKDRFEEFLRSVTFAPGGGDKNE
jgi:hypothetical protein